MAPFALLVCLLAGAPPTGATQPARARDIPSPTPHDVAEAMLTLARVTREDVVTISDREMAGSWCSRRSGSAPAASASSATRP
jgi:hypothetical protein